jgi:hypothetical protein
VFLATLGTQNYAIKIIKKAFVIQGDFMSKVVVQKDILFGI